MAKRKEQRGSKAQPGGRFVSDGTMRLDGGAMFGIVPKALWEKVSPADEKNRILIALNNAKAIWDEEWGAGVTYGEIRRREEFEHSKYYFETADIERARQMYELFSAEADACLAQGLIVPAHDYVLKCSHTFNVLDTRGAIGVTERQAYFGRMRDLSRRVAEAYVEQRQRLEFPWLSGAPAIGDRQADPLESRFGAVAAGVARSQAP